MTKRLEMETTEEKMIRACIEYETQCFMARDFDQWSACWAHRDYVSILEARPDFAEEVSGWDTVSEYMRGLLATGTTELAGEVRKTNYIFQIGTDMAFVRFEENGNASTRVLVKEGGVWKIVHVGVVYTDQYRQKGRYVHDWSTRDRLLEQSGLLQPVGLPS